MDMINGLRSTASFSQTLLSECDNRAYVAAGNAVNLSIDPRFSRRRWGDFSCATEELCRRNRQTQGAHRPNDTEITTAGCRGKHTEVTSRWGRWLHRLVRRTGQATARSIRSH